MHQCSTAINYYNQDCNYYIYIYIRVQQISKRYERILRKKCIAEIIKYH